MPIWAVERAATCASQTTGALQRNGLALSNLELQSHFGVWVRPLYERVSHKFRPVKREVVCVC